MFTAPGPDTLGTDRLLLRRRRVDDAATYRRLWTQRDVRVPAHRQIQADGRPTVGGIAEAIRAEKEHRGPRLLTVVRTDTGEVIGYCGLAVGSAGRADEPELAFELLQEVHGRGYATEAARAVVIWADGAGYRRLWAGVWDWNLASRRVLHKVGFRDTGRVERESEHGQSLLYGREQAFDGPSAQGADRWA